MNPVNREGWGVGRLITAAERIFINVLIGALLILILLSTADLLINLGRDIIDPPRVFQLDVAEMVDAVGSFLLILIGLELVETMRIYRREHSIHVEAVLAVALTAMARKIIVVGAKEPTADTLFGIAAVVASLGFAFFVVSRARTSSQSKV